MNLPVTGVFCAAATPVNADLSPDLGLFSEHCARLLDEGCDGIALLGSTGEANSFTLAERRTILEAALDAGLPADRLMPGTGLCALADTIELTRHALSAGVTKVVMLPPFYYKGVSDEGLYAAYSQIIEALGSNALKIVLYHIPQLSGISISHELIARLRQAFPDTVAGIKDSAGDFANMQAMTARFAGFSVFCGADPLLLPLMRQGGAGSITATSNLVARELATVFRGAARPEAEAEVAAAQARIVAMRTLSNSYAQIPTIKAMVSLKTGQAGWRRMRPPLAALTESEVAALMPAFAAAGGSDFQ